MNIIDAKPRDAIAQIDRLKAKKLARMVCLNIQRTTPGRVIMRRSNADVYALAAVLALAAYLIAR